CSFSVFGETDSLPIPEGRDNDGKTAKGSPAVGLAGGACGGAVAGYCLHGFCGIRGGGYQENCLLQIDKKPWQDEPF
ncbi:MAG: hypothetical protein ACLFVU_13195, partial [Phycisphaerae bacterium]